MSNQGLTHRTSVAVGLEPVAVAARNDSEVWVVNHLSDSVSIVERRRRRHTARVVRTLLVGDEPRDIVFAGPGRRRAFITTAHRGQNVPVRSRSSRRPGSAAPTSGSSTRPPRHDARRHARSTILTLFSDTPRALAVAPDGSTVYAAVFHSGNRTAIVHERPRCPIPARSEGGMPAAQRQLPRASREPEIGLIVKYNGAALGRRARPGLGRPDRGSPCRTRTCSPSTPTRRPAGTARRAPAGVFQGVGTVLFNMVVNPEREGLRHQHRGPERGALRGPGELRRDHSARSPAREPHHRARPRAASHPRHLNKHIDYDTCCAPIPNAENALSVSHAARHGG